MQSISDLLRYEYDRREGRVRDISTLSRGATAEQVADLLEDQAGNKEAGKSREYLMKRWVTSERFIPILVPTAILEPVRIPKPSDSISRTVGPLVVELNFKAHEQQNADGKKRGFIPPVIIIDGQHRHDEAFNRGQDFIHAIVGEKAVPTVIAEMFRWYALGADRRTSDLEPAKHSRRKYARPQATKIDRSAFLYMEPSDDNREFAQCGTCFFWASEKCKIHGERRIAASESCGLYVPDRLGRSIDAELPLVSPEQSGLVSRPVRCENCRSFDAPGTCRLFTDLNRTGQFACDPSVKPLGCCNAQMPKE